jgi:hypothetical protein
LSQPVTSNQYPATSNRQQQRSNNPAALLFALCSLLSAFALTHAIKSPGSGVYSVVQIVFLIFVTLNFLNGA